MKFFKNLDFFTTGNCCVIIQLTRSVNGFGPISSTSVSRFLAFDIAIVYWLCPSIRISTETLFSILKILIKKEIFFYQVEKKT